MKKIYLDVSCLEAPEPLVKIMEVLQTKPDHTVIVHHRIEPMGLYKKLAEAGYVFETVRKNESSYIITIQPRLSEKEHDV